MEIEFLPTPVEETGDILVLSRWLIRNIAYKHGCVATFAPKVEEGIAGNGMHIHNQLRKNGLSIMTGVEGNLSEVALRLIGGLCTYADSLTAFGNMVSSAYLKLVPMFLLRKYYEKKEHCMSRMGFLRRVLLNMLRRCLQRKMMKT